MSMSTVAGGGLRRPISRIIAIFYYYFIFWTDSGRRDKACRGSARCAGDSGVPWKIGTLQKRGIADVTGLEQYDHTSHGTGHGGGSFDSTFGKRGA